MRSVRVLVFIPAILMAWAAGAQPLTEVELLGQPLQYLKEGKVDGCGVRIVGLRPLGSPPTTVQGIDVSFNLFAPGVGSVKGLLMEGPLSVRTADLPRKPLSRIWLRAPGSDATTSSNGQFHESPTDKLALLYTTSSIDSVIALFTATIEKKSIQIGVRAKGTELDRVFFGVVKLSEAESKQIADCLGDFSRNLKQQLPPRQQKGRDSPGLRRLHSFAFVAIARSVSNGRDTVEHVRPVAEPVASIGTPRSGTIQGLTATERLRVDLAVERAPEVSGLSYCLSWLHE